MSCHEIYSNGLLEALPLYFKLLLIFSLADKYKNGPVITTSSIQLMRRNFKTQMFYYCCLLQWKQIKYKPKFTFLNCMSVSLILGM